MSKQKPIFYDPTGRRKKASFIGVISLAILAVLMFVGVVVSIVWVPVPKGLDLHLEYPKPHASKMVLNRAAPRHPPLRVRGGTSKVQQTLAAFYITGDDASLVSLQKHINNLDIVIPGLAYIGGTDNKFVYLADNPFTETLQNAQHKPTVLIMVQNISDGQWQGANTARLVADPAARKKLIGQMLDMVAREKAQGVVLDFETLQGAAIRNYLTFVTEARAAFAARGYQLTLTAPVDDEAWNLKAFAAAADKLFLMIYDQHSMVDPAGPIAAQGWFNERLGHVLKSVPLDKAIVCIGNYGYDWYRLPDGKLKADPSTVAEAWRIARESEAPIQFDPASGNAHFLYDEENVRHEVWLLDAVSAWNQLLTISASNVSGVGLWRLGSEDPGIWHAFRDYQTTATPHFNTLTALGDNQVYGNGEVVHIEETPHKGSRTVTFDKARVAQNEVYHDLPTPYVVRRAGYRPGKLALTFDDGPDARWTPQVLKILEQEKVPATFFVIGEKAISHPALLRQMIRDGNDIGNHSYTHPDMSKIPDWQIRFELNSTQRVVEAYTGRSMRLLRAPYFGDAEPTTNDELMPALIAQQLGYTNVGLHVDSEDWTKPGVDKIIQNTLDGVQEGTESEQSPACQESQDDCRSGQIILMHDSGGVRTETLKALPTIIRTLKARGYEFVTVGDLVGLPRDQVMPKLNGQDLLAVRFDVGIFMLMAWSAEALKWLFVIAIVLGIGRALMLSGLAIYASFSNHMEPPGDDDAADAKAVAAYVNSSFVSVLIPAYNEARVIESSVRRVLESVGVALEVIVIDDGSKDDTSAIVTRAFKDDPRVRLITQANAGKANAVNNGIAASKGEVIIALDADTQFEKETIARLVRWFIRPEIGAVAGNAKVGNRFNWVTKWQAVEYVTSQNLERSALAMFGAMMVVPGAVGAWRRSALAQVGNYPHNTLAEDQDLTIAIQREGWKVAYDQDAVAWTEAPESFAALMKQRFRWAFGTLQCLWKHRAIYRTGKPRGLAMIGIPQAWMFQIGFSVISPLIDFALIVNIIGTIVQVSQHGWAQSSGDLERMVIYWLAFLTIDAICGAIAYWLEPREKSYPVFWLLSQRFVYRQIMYYVVLKALTSAGRGLNVGWGKLERSGRSQAS
ncbi:polysaccharide deacetylase family protein [Asticcacaulis sp. 201]|uniref:polysaccharide deacetylase family protein n=1 Tax=Asticcacaulis sp. 201 TaxID=3028787 RepID=UPI002917112A|nr:glycosyltransferase [Asticcacaulis sp. 201]MDV6331330.1 glycosyltransferase [Asticcacaulis sp. 201]